MFHLNKRVVALLLVICVFVCLASSCKKNKETSPDDGQEYVNYYDFDMTEYLNVPAEGSVQVPLSLVDNEWEYACLKIRLDNTKYTAVEDENAQVELYDKVKVSYLPAESSKDKLTPYQQTFLTGEDSEMIVGAGDFVSAYEHKSDPSKNTQSFEDQLKGLKVGDNKTVTVTFPDDFTYTDGEGKVSDLLAGVCVSLDLTVKGISRGELPELNSSMVSSYTSGQYITVDEYKEYIYGYFKSYYAYEYYFDAISLKGGYPEEALNNARLLYMTEKIDSDYGEVELDEEDINTLYDALYNEADEYARKAVYERMVLEYLFKVCGITLTDEGYFQMLKSDYDAMYYYYYMYYGVATMSEYEDYFGKENLILQYKYEKMMDVLPSKVVFK